MKAKLSTLTLSNPFILAPMAGVTDRPFRLLCKEEGASMVCSEMVSSKGIFYKDKNTEKLLLTHSNETPISFQIFGSDPEVIKYASNFLAPRTNAVLDINMGCPVPKIVKNKEGSHLMTNPELIYDIVKAAKSVSGKPVSVKIRLGWDTTSINAVAVAKIIAEAGGDFITVHGRTRNEFYSGSANWDEIRKVKEAVSIPVIGNGDISSGKKGVEFLMNYGVDAVMVGRGAMGNPFIFRDLNLALSHYEAYGNLDSYIPFIPTLEEKISTLLKQFDLLIEEKGEYVAVRQLRSHSAWYLKGVKHGSKIKQQLNSLQAADDIKTLISKIPSICSSHE